MPRFLLQRRGAAAVVALAMALVLSPTARADEPPPLTLKFSEFFRLPIGPRGVEVSEKLHAADGQQVRIVGYMVQQEDPQRGRFALTARPVSMSEQADGDANDLPAATLTVLLDASQARQLVPYQAGLIELNGRLSVGRDVDADGGVSWVRLQLAAPTAR